MMKKIVLGTLLSSMALFALPNDELELVLISKATQKKAIVLATMHLEGKTKENFGKLYDEYQEKMLNNRMNELKVIQNYAQNLNNLNDKNSDKLINDWIKTEESALTLKKEYVKKFKKVMSSANVIKYFQIENKFRIMREAEIAGAIPLAQPAAEPAKQVK